MISEREQLNEVVTNLSEKELKLKYKVNIQDPILREPPSKNIVVVTVYFLLGGSSKS